jgi:ferredoxin-NADP reductase
MLDESPDVYVCGPPPMIEAAYAALTAAGVPPEQICAERFSPRPENTMNVAWHSENT